MNSVRLLVRLLVRLVALASLLALADLAVTPVMSRRQVQALVVSAPSATAYMERAARAGHPVREYRWVPLPTIAPVAACAVVLSEDEDFFRQGSVTWRAQRVLMQRMLRGDFSRDGSGLSQQLAGNLFLNANRTPRRKAREYLLAHELGQALSKVRILELYLNVVEWGEGIWGIEAASQHYFGVAADSLTPAQAVVLTSFLPAPRRELDYVLGNLALQRQEAIIRKLWMARLLSDRGRMQTLDRVREWRTQTRLSGSAREGWARVAALMGDEAPSFEAAPADPLAPPLPRLCSTRRRGA
ncbi:MAG: transglycosylase domain-containing protein [Gemmatimonadetes bacterium]|nr:transglycosylase domain-containing protein [Gemmatimonadota bacterium]